MRPPLAEKKVQLLSPPRKRKTTAFLNRRLARCCKIGAKHRLPSNGFFYMAAEQ